MPRDTYKEIRATCGVGSSAVPRAPNPVCVPARVCSQTFAFPSAREFPSSPLMSQYPTPFLSQMAHKLQFSNLSQCGVFSFQTPVHT